MNFQYFVTNYVNSYSTAQADSVRAQQHTDFLTISPVKTQV